MAIEPRFREAREELGRLREVLIAPRARRRLARYPTDISEFADLRQVIQRRLLGPTRPATKFLDKESRVVAFGSCFAANIVEALKGHDIDAWHLGYPEEINSPYANRYMLEWVETGQVNASTEAFEGTLGGETRAEVLRRLKEASVVIVSLGVAPAFFDRRSGNFVSTLGSHMNVALMMAKLTFRTPTVTENVECVERIIGTLRRLNPEVHVVLTVSPVPLTATLEMESAIEADCLSKSTLRVTVNEVLKRNLPNVHYWPSFEIVRWIVGGHSGPAFGTEDVSPFHVSRSVIDLIMELFLTTHGSGFERR